MTVRVRRQAAACHSQDLYVSPAPGARIESATLDLKWKPECLRSNRFDLYLYAQQQSSNLPVHAWLNVPSSNGEKQLPLQASWWNATQDLRMNLQMVPSGSQPWESPYPLSGTWTMSATGSSVDPSAKVNNAQVTKYAAPKGLSTGALVAAIVVPIVGALLLAALAWYLWRNLARRRRRRAASAYTTPALAEPSSNSTAVLQTTSDNPTVSYGAFDSATNTYTDGSFGKDTDSSQLSDSMLTSEPEAPAAAPAPLPKDLPPRKRESRRMTSQHRSRHGHSSLGHRSYYSEALALDEHRAGAADLVPATREAAELQRRSLGFRSQSRLGALEPSYIDAPPVRQGSTRRYELDDVSEPTRPGRASRSAALATAPASALLPEEHEEASRPHTRQSMAPMDGSKKRRGSSLAVGAHSREDKVRSYLAGMQDHEPAAQDETNSHHTHRSSMGNRLSLDSDVFQDAFTDL